MIGRNLDENEEWEQCEKENEEDCKWEEYGRSYSKEECLLILSKVIMVAVETAFWTHIYSFHNKLYRQLKGGVIGARLTGEVSSIVMDVWMDRFELVCKRNGIGLYLFLKYVDDVNLMVDLIKEGMRWKKADILDRRKRRLVWSKEAEEVDREEGKSGAVRTMERLQEVANCLMKGLKFT